MQSASMSRPKLTLEIFLVSMAVILFEVGYTRVFSYKLVYYFTYVVIGVSLLGLGAGAVLVAMLPRLRRAPIEWLIPACSLGGGLAVLLGYLLVAQVQLNAFTLAQAIGSPSPIPLVEVAKLTVICLGLFAPFLLAGVIVSLILSTRAADVHRLYFADLMGAGLGCALCVPLMSTISPPGCVILGGALLAAAGGKLAASAARPLLAPIVALAGVLLVLAVFPRWLPDPAVDGSKTMKPNHGNETLFSRWSPVFRIDVLGSLTDSQGLIVVHDGQWGSIIPRYDGDPTSLTHFDGDSRSIPFALLPEGPRVAIIGSAGGHEILASTYFKASHITGVELNPVTVSLLEEHFSDYTSRFVEHENVTLVNAEGRSFLRADPSRYDLVWFVAPDSYAAMNAATSGAYVLSESYLYTVEMVTDSLDHLTQGGIICAQFGERNIARSNRTARYLTTAREAFRQRGIDDFSRHVLVGSTRGLAFTNVIVILRETPFSAEEVARFESRIESIETGAVHFTPTGRPPESVVEKVVRFEPDALERWYEGYVFDVRPVHDDAPFFWHFVSFRDALLGGEAFSARSREGGIGERLLVLLLCLVTVLAALFLLAPLLLRRTLWRTIPYKGSAAIYFASLGVGFMFLEVSLIQRLTLFLGYPTYSLTVTLFALLMATGAGSLLSERIQAPRNVVLGRLIVCLAVLVVFLLFGLTPLVEFAIGWPLALRVALAVIVLSPLGLCLGAFMPLGLRAVAGLSEHPVEYVAWSWAVNGFFSVISSVLGTILSMTFGFSVVLVVALGCYVVGTLAFLRIPVTERA
jgi:hypothetical protein